MMEKMIYFKVHHASKFLSQFTDTKPIGVFKVDVSTIYNEKDHLFERKWAQMINPDSIEVPAGHLLLSIAVTERGASAKVTRFVRHSSIARIVRLEYSRRNHSSR